MKLNITHLSFSEAFTYPELIAPNWRFGDNTISVPYEKFLKVFWDDALGSGICKEDMQFKNPESFRLIQKVEQTPELITKEDVDLFFKLWNEEDFPYKVTFE